MISKEMELAEHAEIPEKSPGSLLAQTRNKLGLTRDEVANQLHLRVKVIESIELDDYSKMPETVFIKGYLRAYANMLELPADDVIALYDQSFKNEKLVERDRLDGLLWQNEKKTQIKVNWFRWFTLAVIVLGVVLIALWWHSPIKNNRSSIVGASENKKLTLPSMEKLSAGIQLAEKDAATLDKTADKKKNVNKRAVL